MNTINKCPICGVSCSVEEFAFIIGSIHYSGFKCSQCNNILYSIKNETEEKLKQIQDSFTKNSGISQ